MLLLCDFVACSQTMQYTNTSTLSQFSCAFPAWPLFLKRLSVHNHRFSFYLFMSILCSPGRSVASCRVIVELLICWGIAGGFWLEHAGLSCSTFSLHPGTQQSMTKTEEERNGYKIGCMCSQQCMFVFGGVCCVLFAAVICYNAGTE